MILVDTTVWVDFFAGWDFLHVTVLEQWLSREDDICIAGLILTEVLQGIRDDRQYRKTVRYLSELIYLSMIYSTFVRSAQIYRSLRQEGITTRKPIDCMIASAVAEHDVSLLHDDRDFDAIERHCGLKVVRQ